MTRRGWTILGAGIALCALCIGAVLWLHARTLPEIPPAAAQATTTPDVDPSSLSIYTSGEYGFAFFYPATAIISDAFTASSSETLSWREGATADGVPIVRVQSTDGEVRLGLSKEKRELDACLSAGPAERSLGSTNIGSTTWSTFSFQKLGTDDEANITSYRYIRDDECIALETIQPRVTEKASPSFSIESIVQSFSLAS